MEHDMEARSNPWRMPESASPPKAVQNNGDATRISYIGERRAVCGTFDAVSLDAAPAQVSTLRSLRTANDALVERYFAIRMLSAFAVTAIPSIMQPSPESTDWTAVQQLLLCEAFVDAQLGNSNHALQFIDEDLRFLRQVQGGQGTLISEMIATAFVARELRVLSALIATSSFPAETYAASLRAMLTPAQSPGSGMVHALGSEYRMQTALMRGLSTMPEQPPPDDESFEAKVDRLLWSKHIAGLFYKPQATMNRSAEAFEELVGLANTAPDGFVAHRDRLRAEFAKSGPVRVDMIYNPVGKMLVEIARPQYDDYIARVFDLAAHVNLVRAQLEIRLAEVPPDRVQSFLASAEPETRNPYDGKPFTWNAANGTLSFQPQSQRWRDWGASVPVASAASVNESR